MDVNNATPWWHTLDHKRKSYPSFIYSAPASSEGSWFLRPAIFYHNSGLLYFSDGGKYFNHINDLEKVVIDKHKGIIWYSSQDFSKVEHFIETMNHAAYGINVLGLT